MADVLKVVMAWTMLIASTVSTVSTAYSLITALTHISPIGPSKLRESGKLVHYNSSQLDLTNHQDLHSIPIKLSSPNLTNLQDLPASEEPPPPGNPNSVSQQDLQTTTPTYLEVSGSGLGENN